MTISAWWNRSATQQDALMDFLAQMYEDATGATDATTSASSYAVIRKATLTLTHAQILTLVSVPVDLIPAPGANKLVSLLVPGPGAFDSRQVAAYTNDAANLVIGFISAGYGLCTFLARNLITFGADAVQPLSFPNASATVDITTGPETALVNQPVQLFMANTLGDLSGGHADNTLTVTVYYTVVDVP